MPISWQPRCTRRQQAESHPSFVVKATKALSASTANTTSMPASLAPSVIPPAPQKRSTPIILSCRLREEQRVWVIKYVLDGQIAYGQSGPDGKITPWPKATLRLENAELS